MVFTPSGRDAVLTVQILTRYRIAAEVCPSVDALCEHLAQEVSCVITTEDAITPLPSALAKILETQEPWSDLPFIVFSAQRIGQSVSAMSALSQVGNVTVLDRPVQVRTLVSAVRAALRARSRQFEARRAIRQRDHFLAMLGHELRNPLGVILVAAEAMGATETSANPRRAIIERQCRHLSRLVDDLLDVSRVTSGKITLKKSVVNLAELLRRAVQSIEPFAKTHDVSLFVDSSDDVFVNGDGLRLTQIFSNLLTNAIKYAKPGAQVKVTLKQTGATCVTSVRDTGIGIAPDMLAHIFDLFAQAAATLDRSEGGMGIGLTLVKSLVELHGGEVSASSTLGVGSEFNVHLPVVQSATAEETVSHPRRRTASGLRVLMVDDNTDLRELFQAILSNLGYVVRAADDGVTGVEQILVDPPDVAIIDIGLPGMDGYAVARRVRAELGDKVFLVAMTGYGQPEDRKRSAEAGFDMHLTKPVTVDMLQKTLLDSQTRRARSRHAATHD